MMAQPFAPHAGMGPGGGHPGLAHGHPMANMQHPGAGHMGGPNPAIMQGMHPGVSGPQVTQGPMITGMPQGPVTSGPGAHAMAHLGPQPNNPMFQQHNQQITFNQLPQHQQQAMMKQRHQLFQMQQQQAQQQNMAGMMPQGNQGMTQQQFAQMRAGMNMPMQQQMQLQAQAQANAQSLQHHQQQQRLMAQAQHQQQMLAQQQQQRNASQQMQISRSQEQASQPPQATPTPAPQMPAQMQQQPAPPTPAPGSQPKQQQPQQANSQQQPQQNQVGTPQQVNDTAQVKQPDMGTNLTALEDGPMTDAMESAPYKGQGILRLLMFQEQLCPPNQHEKDRINDLEYWDEFVRNHFSPFGSLRQQLMNQKTGATKAFQIQFASLARFYHAHFTSGVKELRMDPIGCTETKLPHGGCNVYSPKTYITYVYDNDIRVITEGWIQCNFDITNRIEHLSVMTKAWTEYIPRSLCPSPDSPDQKQSPKMGKNAKKPQKLQPVPSAAPSSCIGDMGVPAYIVQFLEIAEVMMVMGPLMEFSQKNPELRPQDAMHRLVAENAQNMRMHQMANGGMHMNPGQRTPGMNGPNQFASPAMNHLGLPQQGSPHIGGPAHTPSPAHMNHGGIAMVHQMSQGNSNLSGSQGPSTNTSPNVTTKRRRASQVKLEDDNASQEVNGANKVRPSPRIGGKRQKGTA